MTSNYPGALDSFANPSPANYQDSVTVPHSQQHANANDAIEAIQAAVGTNPAVPKRLRWNFAVVGDRALLAANAGNGYPGRAVLSYGAANTNAAGPVPAARECAILTTAAAAAVGDVGNPTSDSIVFDPAMLGAALTAAGANNVGSSITFRLGVSQNYIAVGGTRPAAWPADVPGWQNWTDLATGRLMGVYFGGYGGNLGTLTGWSGMFPTAQYDNYLSGFIWADHYAAILQANYEVTVADAPVDLTFQWLYYAQNQHKINVYFLEALVWP